MAGCCSRGVLFAVCLLEGVASLGGVVAFPVEGVCCRVGSCSLGGFLSVVSGGGGGGGSAGGGVACLPGVGVGCSGAV